MAWPKILLPGLLLAAVTAGASATTDLHLYTENFPPYNYPQQGSIKGINADIVAALCTMNSLRCRFRVLPWKRALHQTLTESNAALFSTSRTPDREEQFLWVGPLVSGNACLYKLRDRDDIIIETKNDLDRYTIGIPRGGVYQQMLNDWGLQEGTHYLTYSKKHDDSRMFKLGKHDLIIGSSVTLKAQLARAGLSVDEVEGVWQIKDDRLEGNFLALNLSVNPGLVSALQTSLDKLKTSGEIDSLIARYLEPEQAEADRGSVNACHSGSVYY